MTKERALEIAVALEQVDPYNWIRRFRDWVKETFPPRVNDDIRDEIIVQLSQARHRRPTKGGFFV